MPVKEKVNKSEEVRKLYASGIKSGSEIVAKLKSKGISVAPSQVYQIISGKKGKTTTKKKSGQSVGSNDTVIDHAVVFVRSAGGITKAKDLLTKLSLLHN